MLIKKKGFDLKKILTVLLFLTVSLFANTIVVAVAANVSYAINDLVKEYQKINKDEKIRVIVGSSGKLATQVKNKASFSLYLSADTSYPKRLYKEGFGIKKPVVYAKGALVLLSSKKRDFRKGLKILLDKDIKRVAIANPKTAPYGKATLEAIKIIKIILMVGEL